MLVVAATEVTVAATVVVAADTMAMAVVAATVTDHHLVAMEGIDMMTADAHDRLHVGVLAHHHAGAHVRHLDAMKEVLPHSFFSHSSIAYSVKDWRCRLLPTAYCD